MNYAKPALTFAQQAALLQSRGLIAASVADIEARLQAVSYYRLSAYWHPFRRPDESLLPGTILEQVWRRYVFDRHLRLLVMDAVERVEVALLRTRMVEQFTVAYGPFGHRQWRNFKPDFAPADHTKLLLDIDQSAARSREVFVEHFRAKYTAEPHLPLWMAAEIMTFGQLFTFFRHLNRTEQQRLAAPFGLLPPVLESWLHTLNYVRNTCAHHARLWNRELPIRPRVPDRRHQPDWHVPAPPANDRIYVVLLLLRHLLRHVAPQSRWVDRLHKLLTDYPEIPIVSMGFPANWPACPLWK
jgi:abortive infection bacteriophage resistance protein